MKSNWVSQTIKKIKEETISTIQQYQYQKNTQKIWLKDYEDNLDELRDEWEDWLNDDNDDIGCWENDGCKTHKLQNDYDRDCGECESVDEDFYYGERELLYLIQQHKNEIRSLESNIDISRNWRKLRIHNSKLWKEYVG